MRLLLRCVWLLIFCSLLFNQEAMGQGNKRISLNLTDAPFLQFVQETERISGSHFYFNAIETDSLHITVKVDDVSLPDLLKKVFENSGFQYAIDTQNRIFVTKKFKVQTTLADGFFDRKKTIRDTITEPIAALPAFEQVKEKLRASLESKLFEIGNKTNTIGKGNAIVTGYARDSKNGEALSGAVVYIDSPAIKTVTDQFGYFTISLPKGRQTLHVNSLGMKDTRRQLMLYSDGKLTIELEDFVVSLKAVTINTDKRSNTRGILMGVDRVNIRTIKQIPAILGESDILRVVLTLPGVTSCWRSEHRF